MAETRLVDIIDAIVTQAPTAPGMPTDALVVDGFPLGQIPAEQDFLAVGIEDPVDLARADSADSTQEFALAVGRSRNEVGLVRCAISTTDANAVPKSARDRAVTILAAVAALARAGATPFGLPGVWQAGVTDVRIYQNQTEYGAECLLVFSLTYTARI